MNGNQNIAIHKTFSTNDITNTSKKAQHRFLRFNNKSRNDIDSDMHSPSKTSKRRKEDDVSELISIYLQRNKNEQGSCSKLNSFGQVCHCNEKDISSRRKTIDCNSKSIERSSKTFNLNQKKDRSGLGQAGVNNMNPLIPGFNRNQRKNDFTSKRSRKSIRNPSEINLNNIRERYQEKEQENNIGNRFNSIANNDNIITESSGSLSKPLKILKPQSEKSKELDEELRKEQMKFVIDNNINQLNIPGNRKMQFIFDGLTIQKLNSIKELGVNNNSKYNQSVMLYNELDGNKASYDKRLNKEKENNIIIINHNYSDHSNKSFPKVKRKLFCCIPMNL